MLDQYSSMPIFVVYIVGFILLGLIVWSLLRDAAKADPSTRKKLVRIYAWMAIGAVAIVAGINYFNVSEKLFPSFYENEELKQEISDAKVPWELSDYQQSFDSK